MIENRKIGSGDREVRLGMDLPGPYPTSLGLIAFFGTNDRGHVTCLRLIRPKADCGPHLLLGQREHRPPLIRQTQIEVGLRMIRSQRHRGANASLAAG